MAHHGAEDGNAMRRSSRRSRAHPDPTGPTVAQDASGDGPQGFPPSTEASLVVDVVDDGAYVVLLPSRPCLRVCLYGAGGELHDAVGAGLARVVALLPMSKRGLPSDWALPVGRDEIVLATTRILVRDVDAIGIAALVVKRTGVPAMSLGDEIRERIAQALVDVVLAELGR
jgi:hypothetical protein